MGVPVSTGWEVCPRPTSCLIYRICDMHRTAFQPHQLWATVGSDQYDEVSKLSIPCLARYTAGLVSTSTCVLRHPRPSANWRHGGSSCHVWMMRTRRTSHASWPLPCRSIQTQPAIQAGPLWHAYSCSCAGRSSCTVRQGSISRPPTSYRQYCHGLPAAHVRCWQRQQNRQSHGSVTSWRLPSCSWARRHTVQHLPCRAKCCNARYCCLFPVDPGRMCVQGCRRPSGLSAHSAL